MFSKISGNIQRGFTLIEVMVALTVVAGPYPRCSSCYPNKLMELPTCAIALSRSGWPRIVWRKLGWPLRSNVVPDQGLLLVSLSEQGGPGIGKVKFKKRRCPVSCD